MVENGEFDVGPAFDLQRKYGWFAENWTPPDFDLAVVPAELHDLIPLARRWGISCDVTRHDAAEKATGAEIAEVGRILQGRHTQIYRWLYTEVSVSDEAGAFQSLLVFEMEEADGPGIPGLLDWRVQEFKREPSEQNRELLQAAYKEVQSWDPVLKKWQPIAEAEQLLGG